MRSAPALLDRRVALAADLVPDVGRDRGRRGSGSGQPARKPAGRVPPPASGREDKHDGGGEGSRRPLGRPGASAT